VATKYSLSDYSFQFITITVGVLIALLINGLVEWNEHRELVADARSMIMREIADNKKDIDATLSGIKGDVEQFESAITFATEMLTMKKTKINQLNFHLNLADLSSTSWRTAERTGALSHMDYAEVQKYSKLYDFQDLIVEQQRNLVSQLGLVTAIISPGFDPDNANPKDLELFRERLMALRATLLVHNQMAQRLAENYAEALKQ
jgi:hypothetical protein